MPTTRSRRCTPRSSDARTSNWPAGTRSSSTRHGATPVSAARAVTGDVPATAEEAERDLTLLGMVALEDPPRPGGAAALAACRRAGIKVAMITGDHPDTARAIAREVGLAGSNERMLTGACCRCGTLGIAAPDETHFRPRSWLPRSCHLGGTYHGRARPQCGRGGRRIARTFCRAGDSAWQRRHGNLAPLPSTGHGCAERVGGSVGTVIGLCPATADWLDSLDLRSLRRAT